MSTSLPLPKIPCQAREAIFAYMDTITKCSMRRCSKAMRDVVNACEPQKYSEVKITFDKNKLKLELSTDTNQTTTIEYFRDVAEYKENCVYGSDYLKRFAIDFSGIVASPNVTIEELILSKSIKVHRGRRSVFAVRRNKFKEYRREEFNIDKRVVVRNIREQMELLGVQMNVKTLEMSDESDKNEVLGLLSTMRPVVLEHLSIINKYPNERFGNVQKCNQELLQTLDEVTSLEQWTRLKRLILCNARSVPMEKWTMFPDVKVSFSPKPLTVQIVDEMVEAALRHGDLFVQFTIPMYAMYKCDESVYKRVEELRTLHSIPESNLQLAFETGLCDFTISRIHDPLMQFDKMLDLKQ